MTTTIPVVHKNADDVLSEVDSGTMFDNAGAQGDISLTLPPATPGLFFGFTVITPHMIEVRALERGNDVIACNGALSPPGGSIAASMPSYSIGLYCPEDHVWVAMRMIGDWNMSLKGVVDEHGSLTAKGRRFGGEGLPTEAPK